MGSVVDMYSGPPQARRLVGKAELIEVLKYKGDGRYLVKCVFVDDPTKRERVREYHIDEVLEKGDQP